MKIFLVAAVLLPVVIYGVSPCSGPPRIDGQCGPNVNGAACSNPDACCSRFGYCGIGTGWCNANSLCPASSSVKNNNNGNQTATIPINNGKPVVKLPRQGSPNQKVKALSGCGRGNRLVALTFDDGPQPGANGNLLAELKANNIKATFFSSPQANGPEQLQQRCDLVKSIVKAGHQLEQHSMNHPHFPSLSPAQLVKEIQDATKFITQCGGSPKKFRPPFGELTSSETQQVVTDLKLPIVMWNVDPRDYELAGVDVNFDRVVTEFETTVGVGNSAIILLHEYVEGGTPGLVTQLAKYFRDLGYKFVTIDECFAKCVGPVCSSGPDDFPGILDIAADL